MKYLLLFFLISLIIFLAVFIPLRIRYLKYEKFVQEHSFSLIDLSIINKKYAFYKILCPTFRHSYDNINFYETVSCRDYLIYQLIYIRKEVQKDIKETWDNKIKFESYKKEISEKCVLNEFDTVDVPKDKKLLKRIESKLFEKTIKRPVTNYSISVKLTRTNINGIYQESKHDLFLMNDIKVMLSKINQKRGDYYLNSDIWNSICRVERAKVSNKMRFAIYERDGYRCRMCHRKRDDLEIDHIIPIAKGGKTTYDNLQTLCHRCNKLKGDKIL